MHLSSFVVNLSLKRASLAVKCATNKPMFFAEKLHQAMKVGFRLQNLFRGNIIVCGENIKPQIV